ncbi:Clp protease N-terminal domain-containing protein [Kitasatospora sp. NPDC097691]|uniref:Clp protease N-terminal domain-containing protein n=1 Tax=Kitasatospora sp. NPDC097691 TaxID=3157231 RepID=UPI0033170871
METTLEADWHTLGTRGGRLGTEHLLTAVVGSSGPAGAALAAAGATESELRALLRDRDRDRDRHGAQDHEHEHERDGDGERGEGWATDDEADAGVPAREVLGSTQAPDLVLTGAAARALSAAVTAVRHSGERRLTAEHVLRALLADDRTRAAELLRAAGVAPQAVRDRLDAPHPGPKAAPPAPPAPPAPEVAAPDGTPDALDPLLHPTRDALLGRRSHRLPLWKRLLKPGAAGPAAPSADWIRLETDEQALRLGRRTPGTEHVLLALLAVHEVLRHRPQPDVDDTGGELLAWVGLDYARAHAALTAGTVALPADPRSVEAYLAGAAPGPLVRALLDEDTRARRLVDALRGGAAREDGYGGSDGSDGDRARPAEGQGGPDRRPQGQRVV